MDLMSALDNMSGDQFGGDTLQPSAVYSPEQPFGNDSDEDSRTSWSAHVTGITPNNNGSTDSDAQPQPANDSDSDSAQKSKSGNAKSGGFPATDPYKVVGRVASSLQTARP